MKRIAQKYKDLFIRTSPILIAIIIVEVMNIETVLYGPLSHGTLMVITWAGLQTIAGFAFGFLSDRPGARKRVLVICQSLGVLGGIILSIFGFEIWVIMLLALMFNPIPVARAFLLDNFPTPKYSQLKLIAITFLAQHSPWVFYYYFGILPYKIVIYCTLLILVVNTVLTIFFFKEKDGNYEEKYTSKQIIITSPNRVPLFLTLIAFIFAEATFYLMRIYLESEPKVYIWLSLTTLGAVIGIGIAMLYDRLPHISIITLAYSVGAATTGLGFIHCFILKFSCSENLLYAMSDYAIIGGLYLPFVTDGVINMVGEKHRGVGAATIEVAGTIASFFAPFLFLVTKYSPISIFIIITLLYVVAVVAQRIAERKLQF